MNRDTSGFVQKVEISTAGRTEKLSRILHVFLLGRGEKIRTSSGHCVTIEEKRNDDENLQSYRQAICVQASEFRRKRKKPNPSLYFNVGRTIGIACLTTD